MVRTLDYIVDGSAKWNNYEQTSVTCVVKFVEIPEELPFTAMESDPYAPWVAEVWNQVVNENAAGDVALYNDNADRQAMVDEIKGWDATYDQAIVDYGQEGFVSFEDLSVVWNEKRPPEPEV